ncbi:NADH-quinone oxidoreductase subunit NuoE [Candidatus Formimonas warabiya]|uniref:NADH-quinone oxidoreductase subunit E n=1 Tax=Formimonas warabiya TaxID=1761012 RepID=A0A3G1KMH8_FORW1|nr:NADH-quinone oxidoreductase subunit NuoE [Candidatus Formimonas warabiya]ATW23663.1 NADH-quinone oxidoreductase subunit E [Candidatus Formimonas warabiya]
MVDYKEMMTKYAPLKGGMIEAFHAVQNEINYLPEEAIIAAAEAFGVPVKEAYGVATFYSFFSTKTRGKYIIRICESAPCHIAGAEEVIQALEKELGISMGETTPDGKFTLEFTECIGQCQKTPVISINSKPYEGMTPEKISQVLAEYK